MQAILRRTARVQARAVRKDAKRKRIEDRNDHIKKKRERLDHRNETKTRRDDALAAAKLDWYLGPLAPKRQLDPKYGTIPSEFTRIPKPADPNLNQPLPPDTPVLMNKFCQGDRVVILAGPNKGRIGTIDAVYPRNSTVTIFNTNKAYVTYSDFEQAFYRERDFTETGELESLPISISAIRLVHNWHGQDVIVDRMQVTMASDGGKGNKWKRQIPGTLENLNIHRDRAKTKKELQRKRDNLSNSYVPKADDEPLDYHPSDTFRLEVDDYSWVPSMEEPPMPASIIDELRNKYSKFRKRHDDEFVAQMMALDDKQEVRQKSSQLMLKTPAKEIYRLQKQAAKQVASKQALSDESLSLLGEHMAKHMKISGATPAKGSVTSRKAPQLQGIEGVSVKSIPKSQPEAKV